MIDTESVTSALLAALRGQLGKRGAQVYDHQVPASVQYPYAVLYRIPGGGWAGPPLWDPEADVTLVYQVDAVSNRRDSVELCSDWISRVVVGRAGGQFETPLVLPTEMALCDRMRAETPGGIEQEGLPPNQIFSMPQRFEITVTPSQSGT